MNKSNAYHFISNWRVEADAAMVCDILEDAEALKEWWPSVYLDVRVIEPGGTKGIGKVVSLYTKGWLPYTLIWKFRVTESDAPRGYTIEAFGDFEGRGVWTFTQNGKYTDIQYDWKINAEKGLLKHLSFLMKPLFAWNHKWAMKKGEDSLKLELIRRQGKPSERPPGPTFPHQFTNNRIL